MKNTPRHESISRWARSSYCADAACVEVATFGDHVGVRDAKQPEQQHLLIGRDDWLAFLDEVVAGHYKDI